MCACFGALKQVLIANIGVTMFKLNTASHDVGDVCFDLPDQGVVVSWILHLAFHVEKVLQTSCWPQKWTWCFLHCNSQCICMASKSRMSDSQRFFAQTRVRRSTTQACVCLHTRSQVCHSACLNASHGPTHCFACLRPKKSRELSSRFRIQVPEVVSCKKVPVIDCIFGISLCY